MLRKALNRIGKLSGNKSNFNSVSHWVKFYRSYSGTTSKGKSFFIRNYEKEGRLVLIKSSSEFKTYSHA